MGSFDPVRSIAAQEMKGHIALLQCSVSKRPQRDGSSLSAHAQWTSCNRSVIPVEAAPNHRPPGRLSRPVCKHIIPSGYARATTTNVRLSDLGQAHHGKGPFVHVAIDGNTCIRIRRISPCQCLMPFSGCQTWAPEPPQMTPV